MNKLPKMRCKLETLLKWKVNNAIVMCRLPLPADTITPVQHGIFVTCVLCQIQSHTKHSRTRTTLKDKDVGLKDQGQELTSLSVGGCAGGIGTVHESHQCQWHWWKKQTRFLPYNLPFRCNTVGNINVQLVMQQITS